jgi:hypothetical protein
MTNRKALIIGRLVAVFVLAMLAAGRLGAAPPTTRESPAAGAFRAAQERVARADAAEAAAEAECLRSLEATEAYRTADRERAAAEDAYRRASGGTLKERMDASAAMNRARAHVQEMRGASLAGDGAVKVAAAEVVAARANHGKALAAYRLDWYRQQDADRDAAAYVKAPELTLKELELKGEQYRGEFVKIVGCRLTDVGTHVESAPNVKRGYLQGEVLYDEAVWARWISVDVEDREVPCSARCVAPKEPWADRLATVKPGARLRLFGRVTAVGERPYSMIFWGVVCQRIEMLAEPDK